MRTSSPQSPHRAGKILVMSALLLPVLLGMVGLVIDGGLLMASHRHTQNAADAAALAAAMDVLRGRQIGTATATAKSFVQDPAYNNLQGSTVTINKPPTLGPYAGATDFIEAIVSTPLQTSFIQILGVNASRQVQARAVAGIEAVSAGEGAIVLDPNAVPGMKVAGGGHLVVNGRVVINSQGKGLDEKNTTVDLGLGTYGASTGNGSTVQATDIQIVGGVDTPSNFKPYNVGDPSPLHARALPEPDPLRNLETPTSSTPGINTTVRGAFQATNGTLTIQPGIYDQIIINNNANVTLSPASTFSSRRATRVTAIKPSPSAATRWSAAPGS